MYKKRNMVRGFSLLEIMMVLIAIGAIASLAIPKLKNMVEYSKCTEAYSTLNDINQSMTRCYIKRDFSYSQCVGGSNGLGKIDLGDPNATVGKRFNYVATSVGANGYKVTATRNSVERGDPNDTATLTVTAGNPVQKSGTGNCAAY